MKHRRGDAARRCLGYLCGLGNSGLVRSSWSMSSDEFWSYQACRLAFILKYAVHNIPYYRVRSEDYLNGEVGEQGDVRPSLFETLSRLPVIGKETVRDHHRDFINPRWSPTRRYYPTTGTTGSPLKVAANLRERCLTIEITNQWYSRLTGGRYPRTLLLRGSWVKDDDIYRISRPTGDMHLSIYSLSEDKAETIEEIFDAYAPDLIFGYPSAMNQLALILGEEVREGRDSRIAFTVSEVLQPQWRGNIEAALCAEVHDFYTSEEGSHLVMQCSEGTMHINPLLGIVEILDDRGDHVESGGRGRVVVTGLAKTSMPLIRYELGDIAVSTGYYQRCACGLHWPSIGGIEGREEELIVTRDGRRFSQMIGNVVKGLDGIRESQLVQVDYESFVLKIVEDRRGKGEIRREEGRIKGEIERCMGAGIDLVFEYVDHIPRDENGKLATVVVAMERAREES